MDVELDFIELFYVFWKKKIWLILAIIIGIAFGYCFTKYIIVPKYGSTATLILSKTTNHNDKMETSSDSNAQSGIALNQKLITTYEEIMKSKRVSNKVINNLNLKLSYNDIINSIKVSYVQNSDVMKLTITTFDPELSTEIANEMTKVFMEEVATLYNIKSISIIDKAEINRSPVNVNYKKNMFIASITLFIITSSIIFLVFYFDNTIKTEENVQKVTGLPVLSSIPVITNEEKGGKKRARR